MENRGLLFIPDISGFTDFVNRTEIEHSRMIIQELLEILIESNEIGLEISEIEGDAILFYKFGEAPSLQAMYAQVEKMFCAFHQSLASYDNRKYCLCKACVSASSLTLKVITHYGEFTGYNVQHFSKLIGKDIIVAHQLLKNDIDQHEYWLVTSNVAPQSPPGSITDWMQWKSSAKKTEAGEIVYHFTPLSPLKQKIASEPPPRVELSGKKKIVSCSGEFSTDIITMFHATGDFNLRNKWRAGVKRMEQVSHYLPRVGMKCKSVSENGESIIYASSYYYNDVKVEFSETEENTGNVTFYILEKTGDHKIRFTLEYYINGNFPSYHLFSILHKKRLNRDFERSFEKLQHFLLTYRLEDEYA